MNKRSFLAIAFPCLFAACAFGYQARGQLSDVNGEMRGKAYPANNGGGRFVLTDQTGVLTCDGLANAPSISLQPGSCDPVAVPCVQAAAMHRAIGWNLGSSVAESVSGYKARQSGRGLGCSQLYRLQPMMLNRQSVA